MKKWGILFGVFLCLILFFSIHCKSPATSEADIPAMAAESDTSTDSQSDTTTLGTLVIMMKDKPVEDADQVLVKISNIKVHMADPDEFIEVSALEQDIELLELKKNPTAIVSTELKAGHYNQIRMDVLEGSIVFLEDDGLGGTVQKPYNLKIPSNEIKIPVQFYIEGDDTTEITLDFDAEKSIKYTKKGKKDSYTLRPVIKVIRVRYQ